MPPPRRPKEHYVRLGRAALLELLAREHAAVWDEVEAKIADRVWPTLPHYIEPHHLTTAKLSLLAEELIAESTAATRGGRPVSVLHLADVDGRRTAVSEAAGRKRLLHARYLRWTQGDKSTAAIIGRAGERCAA